MVLNTETLDIADTQSLSVFDAITQMGFGDGLTTPSVGDTGLSNELLKLALLSSVKDLGDNTYEFVGRLPLQDLVGEDISELGIFNDSDEMGGRALSPAIITNKSSDDEYLFTMRVKTKTIN